MIPVQFENIPAELKAEPRWGLWKFLERGGRRTKFPCQPTNDPERWFEFSVAVDLYRRYIDDGPRRGLAFLLGNGWGGGDWDGCVRLVNGRRELIPEALELLQLFRGAYYELSPGLEGIKIFYRSTFLGHQLDFSTTPPTFVAWRRNRYFTVTGISAAEPVVTLDMSVEIDPAQLLELPEPSVAEDFVQSRPGEGYELAQALSDEDLVLAICGSVSGGDFLEVWGVSPDGSPLGQPRRVDGRRLARRFPPQRGGESFDHSRADQVLVNMLAWWCDFDAARVDRLFRSSGLMRPKWNVKSYRTATLQKALSHE